MTGAASGIGLALSKAFAGSGYRVAMSDVREEALADARDMVARETSGSEPMAIRTDVTDARDVDALAASVVDAWGSPDILVNNAGIIGPVGPVWEGSLDQWELAMRINYWGVLHGMRAFLPHMIARGSGRLINTASVASWSSGPRMGSYGSTKHAVLALTESASRELREIGSPVRVSMICPTTVRTSLVSHLEQAGSADDVGRERLLAAREHGLSPDEVARIVLAGIKEDRYVITTDEAWLVNAARQRLAIAEGAEPPLDREPPRH
ncbi:SDR family oxidoreductase [Leifsonia sp. Root227]|uniref:SDR family oxidoreductase n=1 Tax=Leifsonia sp. Root227 TaxID=1736496 RepID=UPI00138F2CF3|nr:SDR family oxidoreductase [Leifsonia sp. Root227]